MPLGAGFQFRHCWLVPRGRRDARFPPQPLPQLILLHLFARTCGAAIEPRENLSDADGVFLSVSLIQLHLRKHAPADQDGSVG
jgi:hypothetical protein